MWDGPGDRQNREDQQQPHKEGCVCPRNTLKNEKTTFISNSCSKKWESGQKRFITDVSAGSPTPGLPFAK